MKFKLQDLLTLLIGLFLFSSCNDTSTISLDLDPNSTIEGTKVDTLTVNSRVLLEGPLETAGLVRHPFGYIIDPIFGTTEASLAMTVNTPDETLKYDFGGSPVLDSAVLVLNYGSQFYGDTTTSNYSFEVKQLSHDIYLDNSYKSDRDYPVNPLLLGSYTGKIKPTTKFKVTDIVKGKPDTLRIVTPQVRIKLNNSFIQTNIVNGDFANNTVFQDAFHGLKLTLNKAGSTGNLGLMFFNFSGSDSRLELYYKKTSSGVIDTVMAAYPITTTRNPIGASITHNYTGTAIATQLANPGIQYPVAYVQGAAGVRTKISFPYLSKFRAAAGKLVVNKAELVVSMSAGTNAAPYLSAPRLALYREDIAGQRLNVLDRLFFQSAFGNEASGDAAFGGYYDSLKNQYVFVITSYLQNLIDGKDFDYGTFLSVTPSTEFIYETSTGTAAARSVIGSGARNGAGAFINPTNRIKVNVYYTKIN